MRILTAILLITLLIALPPRWCESSEGPVMATGTCDCAIPGCDGSDCCCSGDLAGVSSAESSDSTDHLSWLDDVKVGYDDGFVVASRRALDLQNGRFPFRLQINGWGQLRYAVSDIEPPNRDLNQIEFKRARLVFSGHAFDPDFSYFLQLDGRSSSGDDLRLLDYFISYDIGHGQFGLEQGALAVRAGKYKVPLTMARWLSGRELEFADRSVASVFFDANRSLAVGLLGESNRFPVPIQWEAAIFNGLNTGGAQTGNNGTLDNNFAYSARIFGFPIGDWGKGHLADFDGHDQLAMRVGCGFAATTIDRLGSSEFSNARVVDSGSTLAAILPATVDRYAIALFAVNTSFKYRGWSTTLEYYFRNLSDFRGASVPDLFDHGFWYQLGYFVVPDKLELLTRWSRVAGDSATLGVSNRSSDEVAGGVAWYFCENQAKLVSDVTHLDGAPISSSALDIVPGDRGWLYRTQIQFSF